MEITMKLTRRHRHDVNIIGVSVMVCQQRRAPVPHFKRKQLCATRQCAERFTVYLYWAVTDLLETFVYILTRSRCFVGVW